MGAFRILVPRCFFHRGDLVKCAVYDKIMWIIIIIAQVYLVLPFSDISQSVICNHGGSLPTNLAMGEAAIVSLVIHLEAGMEKIAVFFATGLVSTRPA